MRFRAAVFAVLAAALAVTACTSDPVPPSPSDRVTASRSDDCPTFLRDGGTCEDTLELDVFSPIRAEQPPVKKQNTISSHHRSSEPRRPTAANSLSRR